MCMGAKPTTPPPPPPPRVPQLAKMPQDADTQRARRKASKVSDSGGPTLLTSPGGAGSGQSLGGNTLLGGGNK